MLEGDSVKGVSGGGVRDTKNKKKNNNNGINKIVNSIKLKAN